MPPKPSQRVAPPNQYPPDAMPKIGRIIFHIGTAAAMFDGFWGLQNTTITKEYIGNQYGGHFQYLTILGLFGTIITMMMSGICDYLPAVQGLKPLKRIFLLFALPVELVISSIYWGIILLKPELMLPPNPVLASSSEPSSSGAEDPLFRIPLLMDLSMHALPAVALIIDFFFLERKYKPPASTFGALALAATFGTAYSLWVEHCASINGSFPYPFLTIMNPQQRIMMYAGSTIMAWLVFRGLNAIHK
ncbi:hypothetical protein I302_105293 [Kwoniella bestiolae CBS 10118]|uniref:FAR-17a/AIG1-like protein n=1 Tax=Kwoniella bestiolae CBS 10118 TaxID=1296100 RepID=A0A1B9FSR1_9TREE|nr:hypothetical protein I302_08581 [Kwoniella bestiolae CBS 10118]OCF21802.1 hypothetical protein I302_08581 [Kwoniella bestiolae CBS 10118]